MVSSQVYDWTVALKPIIDDVMSGNINGVAYSLTLENKGLLIEFNPDYKLDDAVKTAGEDAMNAIIAGDISFEIAEDGTLSVIEGTPMPEPTATPSS